MTALIKIAKKNDILAHSISRFVQLLKYFRSEIFEIPNQIQ